MTALLLAAHGTRSAAGVKMIGALANALAPSAPSVHTAFVDVLGPSPAEVLRTLDEPVVVVPAFLASGYHVHTDVPREIASSGHEFVAVTAALGPDPALAQVQELRLRAAGWLPGDAVVMAAAGSSDIRALRDVKHAAGLLSSRLHTPVRIGFAATARPAVADVVAQVRADTGRRVFVSSYLLAHGLFQERLHAASADGVSAPLGVHPVLTRLLLRRYWSAAAAQAVCAA